MADRRRAAERRRRAMRYCATGQEQACPVGEGGSGACGFSLLKYLSNADPSTPVEELARVVLASHRVEDCFRRAKKECGLAEYEVQSCSVVFGALASSRDLVFARDLVFDEGNDAR